MIRYIRLMLLLLVFQNCEQVIDINPSGKYNGTVFLEGLLVVGKTPRIYLMEAPPFAREKVTPQQVFARGAAVTLINRGAEEILKPDSAFNSFRCRWEPFYGGENIVLWGETYELKIVYKGTTYTASTSINQGKPEILRVDYNPDFYDIYGGHDGVNILLKDLEGAGNYYRFQMNRQIDNSVLHAHILDVIKSNCTEEGEKFWVTDLGRTIFTDEGNDGQELDLLVEVSFEYSKGDSTWITMQSLDEKAAFFTVSLTTSCLPF